MTTASFVPVDGATLRAERRGDGPPLLLIHGAVGDSGVFGAIADLLAADHTVLTYDRRGYSRSPLDRASTELLDVARQSDDAVAVLRHHGFTEALIFGSSAGAVIGLDLAARHPDAVTGLIAHEPPAIRVLPDAATWLAFFVEIERIHRAEGAWPAFVTFSAVNANESARALFRYRLVRRVAAGLIQGLMRQVTGGRPSPVLRWTVQGVRKLRGRPTPDVNDPAIRELRETPARSLGNVEFVVATELPSIVAYVPDLDGIVAGGSPVVLGVGHDTRRHYYSRTSAVIAERLGMPLVEFPGGHTAYADRPKDFLPVLREALTTLSAGEPRWGDRAAR
jgi:pimeloyl-ACP methyl ester carboxylesterase